MNIFHEKSWRSWLICLFFIAYTAWWAVIQIIEGVQSTQMVHYFAGTYGLVAVFGAFWGIQAANKWTWKSLTGRAILMFSLGLLFQEFGQLAYAFYIIIFKIDIPYPSIGDLGFFGSIFFYTYGVYLLAKISGVKFSIKSYATKIQAIIIPLLMLGITYAWFLRNYVFDWSQPLTIFLDFGYPLGQTFYIALTIFTFLVTNKVLGGVMRNKIIFVFFALIVQFLADLNFLVQSANETWTTAGYGDFLYFAAYFVMTLALIELLKVFDHFKSS